MKDTFSKPETGILNDYHDNTNRNACQARFQVF